MAELSHCLGQGHTCLGKALPLPTEDSPDPLGSLQKNLKFLVCWFPRCWHSKLELDSQRRGGEGEGLRGQAGSPLACFLPHFSYIPGV